MENKKPGFLDELEENIMLIPMGISLLLILVSFVMQLFASPEAIAAVQQVSYYAYAWVASIALALCARRNRHMRIPVLEVKMSESTKKVIYVFHDVLGLVVLVVMLIFSLRLVGQVIAEGTMDSKVEGLPIVIAYAATVVGYAAACVRTVLRMAKKEGGK